MLAAGWASDRFFAGRRYQIIVAMTVGMVVAFAFLATVGMSSLWVFAVGLSLCGFMLMGPDSLIAGVGAIDIGGRRGAIVAAAEETWLNAAHPTLSGRKGVQVREEVRSGPDLRRQIEGLT